MMGRIAKVMSLGAGIGLSGAQVAAETSVTGFVGVMMDNVWEEVVFTPWDVEPLESGVAAVTLRQMWNVPDLPFRLGAELGLALHTGEQDHLEISLPIVAEYRPEGAWAGPLEGMGFGLGLSWASAPPEVEIRRGGATQQLLFYWLAEAAFESPWEDTSVVLRLHHRSDGFGILDADTGSNAVMLGLRRAF